MKPLYANGTFKKGPDQFVPGWDNQKAGTIFDQMLVKTGNKIDARRGSERRPRRRRDRGPEEARSQAGPAGGQDATPQGFQNIIPVGRR